MIHMLPGSVSCYLTGASGGDTHKAHAFLEVCLAVELEQGDVVVQGLAVVVVMDVGGGHPECLGPGTAVLLSEVMVTHSHIDGVSCSHDAETVKVVIPQYSKKCFMLTL